MFQSLLATPVPVLHAWQVVESHNNFCDTVLVAPVLLVAPDAAPPVFG
jgi:hypothetical protein